MGIDHRRFDVAVAQRLLDSSNVMAAFEQVGRKGVPEGVARGPLLIRNGEVIGVTFAAERGGKLLTLEAMKMQSNIYAPIGGRITKLLVTPGQHVEPKDLLVSITP